MNDANPADLDERLARELDDARVRIEELAVGLCLDPAVFARHAASLQGFDQLAQVIGEVARMVRRRSLPDTGLKEVRLEAMRARLEAPDTVSTFAGS